MMHLDLSVTSTEALAFDHVVIWNPLTWRLFGDLDAPQVNMLANLSHWNVVTDDVGIMGKPNREVFESMFRP